MENIMSKRCTNSCSKYS